MLHLLLRGFRDVPTNIKRFAIRIPTRQNEFFLFKIITYKSISVRLMTVLAAIRQMSSIRYLLIAVFWGYLLLMLRLSFDCLSWSWGSHLNVNGWLRPHGIVLNWFIFFVHFIFRLFIFINHLYVCASFMIILSWRMTFCQNWARWLRRLVRTRHRRFSLAKCLRGGTPFRLACFIFTWRRIFGLLLWLFSLLPLRC